MPDNELRSLRIELGLPARDMVAVVQGLYPKYDKTMQSKCENGDDYSRKSIRFLPWRICPQHSA